MSYEGYSDKRKQASLKYRGEKQRQIALSYKKEEYESIIEPAIKKSGKPVATFIKEAIKEKIQREGLATY